MRKALLVLLCSLLPASVSAAVLRGVVFESSGNAVAGARVEVFAREPVETQLRRAIAGEPDPSPLASASTNAAGEFSIDIARSGFVRLAVKAEGFAPDHKTVATDDTDVVVALTAAKVVKAYVRGDGKPLASARVLLLSELGETLTSTKTDESGAFSLPDPKAWAQSICAMHPSFAPKCTTFNQMRSGAALDVTLDRGIAIKGRVAAADGKPVPNAQLSGSNLPLGTTGADGSFVIPHAPSDVKFIRAVAAAGVGAVRRSPDVTITLTTPRSFTGNVRDEKGHAVAGALVAVQLASAEELILHTAVTGADGQYRVTNLMPEKSGIWLLDGREASVEPGEADLRRADGRHDFVLRTPSFIRGTVIDEDRRPIAGASVEYTRKEIPLIYAIGQRAGSSTTGPAGTFRLPSMQFEGLTLLAMHHSYAGAFADVPSGATRVTITLPRGVEVTGIVKNEAGEPVGGAKVVANSAANLLGTPPLGAYAASGNLKPWTTADDNGRFAIHLGTGVHDLHVWSDGYAASSVAGVEVKAGMTPLRVVLKRGAEIRGRVVTGDGKPVTEGYVSAIAENEPDGAQQAVNSDGSFVLGPVASGQYVVKFQSTNGTASRAVTAPATGVVLQLPALNEISGRVSDKATGQPVTSFTIASTSPEASFYVSNEFTDAEGRFRVSLPAGSVEMTFSAEDHVPLQRTVNVDPSSQPAALEIALVKGRKLHGRVTSASGTPLAEVSVMSDDYRDGAQTDDDGQYELLAPHTQTQLKFTSPGYVPTARPVPEGSTDLRIDAVLNNGATLSGRVVDTTGAAVPEATIYASSSAQDAESQFAQAEKDGTFTLSGLAAAQYSLSAQKPGLGSAKPVQVDATKPLAPVTLVLLPKKTGRIRGTLTGFTAGGWLGAMVSAQGESDSASAQIGRDGRFVIENAPVGQVSVAAMLTGMSRSMTSRRVRVDVPAGGEVEVQLTLAGEATISGRITSSGQPVAGATVGLNSSDGMWLVTSGAGGAYEIAGIDSGRYGVSIQDPGGASFHKDIEVMGSGTFDFDIAQARISGRVIDARNAPVEGAAISVVSASRSNEPAHVATDVAGTFSVSVQADQEYRVSATKKGFAVATATVDARSAASPVTLRLDAAAAARVRLVDARNGSTLRGFVVVTDERGVQVASVNDPEPDGTIALPLVAGTYRVSASANGFASQTIRMTIPSEETRIGLTPGGTLIVTAPANAHELIRLVLPNGEEYVRCYCNGIAEIRLDGAVTKVENVAPAMFRMDVIDARGARVKSMPVTIIEGQTTSVDVTK